MPSTHRFCMLKFCISLRTHEKKVSAAERSAWMGRPKLSMQFGKLFV